MIPQPKIENPEPPKENASPDDAARQERAERFAREQLEIMKTYAATFRRLAE